LGVCVQNSWGKFNPFYRRYIKIEALPPNTTGSTYEALACMSDKAGDLLFYTNNCTVFDKNHEVMENGEGLNPGRDAGPTGVV
jgi:hypothetical protein